MRSIRTIVVSAAAAALVVGTAGLAMADEIRTSSTDASYDAATRTFTLQVGQSATATVTYYTTDTGKSGCDLTGSGSHVTFGSASSVDGVVSGLTPEVTFTECGDEDELPVQTVTFTGAAPGTTEVSFGVDHYASNGKGVSATTFESALAGFTVVVLADGRHAPAIANEYLHGLDPVEDAGILSACREANGTNPDKSNWHGQLVNKIAQFFGDRIFTEEQEYVVTDKVLEYCGL